VITSVAAGSSKDVDIAVEAAKKVCPPPSLAFLSSIGAKHSHILGIQNDLGFEMPWKCSGKTVEQACRSDGRP
jgi:hypothetical protein